MKPETKKAMFNAYMEEAARWMLKREQDAYWCGLLNRPQGEYAARCERIARYNIAKADAVRKP